MQKRSNNGSRFKSAPLRVALLYFFIGTLWIIISDRIAFQVLDDFLNQSTIQTVKGIGFVLVSATLIYYLVRQMQSDLIIEGTELEARLREIETLHSISSIAAQAEDKDEFLSSVTEFIGTKLYPDHFGFGLLDEELGVLRPHKSYRGIEGEYYDAQIPLENSVAGKAISIKGPVRLHDVRKETAYFSPGTEMKSELAVPIFHKGEALGVINAESSETNFFSKHDEVLLLTIADQIASTLQRLDYIEELKDYAHRQEGLRKIDLTIASSYDLQYSLKVVVEEIRVQLNVQAAEVLTVDWSESSLEYAASKGFSIDDFRLTHIEIGEGFGGKVAQERKTILLNSEDEILEHWSGKPYFLDEGFVSACGVPLIASGRLNGILVIFDTKPLPDTKKFHEVVELLAGQAAIAIEHANTLEGLRRNSQELKIAFDETIEGWARALSLKDRETAGHSRRVTENVLKLADVYGVSKDEMLNIKWGALLHDIGKMGVRDQILFKEGSLTPEERKEMQQHPIFAREMMLPIRHLRGALDIPAYHHEKWDGSGYPEGLKEDQIPLAARLFAVIDVWDALTTDRPYREAWSEEKAKKYIINQSGQHFDPDVVDEFMSLIDEGKITTRASSQ